MNIIKALRKPHPFIYNMISIIVPGVISFGLISIMTPFGFNDLNIDARILFALLFGIIGSGSVILVIETLKYTVPAFINEEKWTIGREIVLILLVVVVICVINFCAFLFLDLSNTSKMVMFQKVVLYTITISVIPILVMVLAEQYSYQKKKLTKAVKLTKELRNREISPFDIDKSSQDKLICFRAENGKIELQLMINEVLFLKSDGNYVEVFYHQKEKNVSVGLIRNRLKAFVQEIPDTYFFQCHKSYAVNIQHIIKVEGNARNFELIIRGSDHRIPVSRSKSEELKNLLTTR